MKKKASLFPKVLAKEVKASDASWAKKSDQKLYSKPSKTKSTSKKKRRAEKETWDFPDTWKVTYVSAARPVVVNSEYELTKGKLSPQEEAATPPGCDNIYYLGGTVPRPCCTYGGCKRPGCPALSATYPDLSMEHPAEPCALVRWFQEAADQALVGKGFERHNLGTPNLPFEEQTICRINKEFGTPDFALGQAWKKLVEARGMWNRGKMREATKELQGAAVYLAAASLSMMQEEK